MDIADVAYELISHTSKGKTAIFVVSDWATENDWIKALADNGIEVKYQQISIEALVENMGRFAMNWSQRNQLRFCFSYFLF